MLCFQDPHFSHLLFLSTRFLKIAESLPLLPCRYILK